MVQQSVCGYKAPPYGNFLGKADGPAVEIGHFTAAFGTDKHPCSCISYPEGPPQVDKPVNPATPDVTEFKS
jgi:hypothetical protein